MDARTGVIWVVPRYIALGQHGYVAGVTRDIRVTEALIHEASYLWPEGTR